MREIERRIQRAESAVSDDLTLPEVPSGVPPTFQEHLKLLMDLQVIAFQAEITRVSTLMFARELSGAVFPETNIRDPFHNLSHHSNDRGNMDRFALLNTYHMQKFAYLIEKLKNTPDGDGTLLDHSLVLYGSSLSDGNQHNFSPLPDRPRRRRVRRAERGPPPSVPEGHAHVEPPACHAGQAGRADSRSSATAPGCSPSSKAAPHRAAIACARALACPRESDIPAQLRVAGAKHDRDL